MLATILYITLVGTDPMLISILAFAVDLYKALVALHTSNPQEVDRERDLSHSNLFMLSCSPPKKQRLAFLFAYFSFNDFGHGSGAGWAKMG